MQGIIHNAPRAITGRISDNGGALRGGLDDYPKTVIENIFDPEAKEAQDGTGNFWIVYPLGTAILVCQRKVGAYFRLPTVSGKKYRFYTGCDYPESTVYSKVSLNGYLSGTAAPLDLAGNPFPDSGDFQPIPGENNPVDFIARGETTLVFRCLNAYATVQYFDPQVLTVDEHIKKLSGFLRIISE